MNLSKAIALLLTLIVSLIAGSVFQTVGMVIPWLLGPLLTIIILKHIFSSSLTFYWPNLLRSIGLFVIGLQLGGAFTISAAKEMMENFPFMVLMTFLLISFSLLLAFIVAKITGINMSTAILGSFPGGLSQMVIVGEEMKRANEAIIAFMQTLRILLVIISVPLTARMMYGSDSSSILSATVNSEFLIETEIILLLIFLSPICIWLGTKAHMPIPFMLVPLLIVAVAQVTIVPGTAVGLPDWLINMAQVCVGAHLGYSMKINRSFFTIRMVGATLVSNLVLISFCFGLSETFSLIWKTPFKDMFLAAAPGGIAEMGITAIAIRADVAFVTSFQLFRLLVILLIVTPIMKWLFLRKELTYN